MRIPDPLVPKEHGAWVVLVVPIVVGATTAGRCTLELVLLTISAIAVFMSYGPLQAILRHIFLHPQTPDKLQQAAFWAALYVTICVMYLVPLLAQGLWLILALAVPGLIASVGNYLLTLRSPRTIPGDLMAVAGLTLGAPAAYYVVSGTVGTTAFVLWLLNFLFFSCSVFYVHMKIRASAAKKPEFDLKEKLALGTLNLIYLLAVIVLVSILSALHYAAQWTVLAFVPMAVQSVYGTHRLSSQVAFKNLGLALLLQSLVFALLLWILHE